MEVRNYRYLNFGCANGPQTLSLSSDPKCPRLNYIHFAYQW